MFGIKKVAEGVTIPEKNLPLDINHRKLLDWLVDRKQVPENWNTELEKLEKEIEYGQKLLPQALKDIHLQGDLWYNRIEKLLQDVEKGETGWTGSALGRAWRRVMKHLKYKKLFLAHSSRLLLSLVNYEIPSLNKRLERLHKQQNEHRRKEQEYKRIGAEERTQFRLDCQKYDIAGENIHEELNALVSKLPMFFERIAEAVKDEKVKGAIHFYEKFVAFLSASEEGDDLKFCPVLSHVVRYGNVSVELMERRNRGETISDVEDEESGFVVVENGSEEEMATVDIQWPEDDEEDVPMGAASDIQWDIDMNDEEGDVPLAEGVEISWDIDVTANDTGITDDSWEIEVEDGGIDKIEQVAQTDVETNKEPILEYPLTRNQFQDDLLEIQAFLKQRLQEMITKDNLVLASILQKAPRDISEQNIEAVEKMLEVINGILELLWDAKFRMIVEIKASSRYTERLVNDIKRRLDTASRMDVLAAETNSKQQEVEENIMRLQLEKVSLIKEANEIKSHLQNQLSLALDRPVNIMGDIHSVLAS